MGIIFAHAPSAIAAMLLGNIRRAVIAACHSRIDGFIDRMTSMSGDADWEELAAAYLSSDFDLEVLWSSYIWTVEPRCIGGAALAAVLTGASLAFSSLRFKLLLWCIVVFLLAQVVFSLKPLADITLKCTSTTRISRRSSIAAVTQEFAGQVMTADQN